MQTPASVPTSALFEIRHTPHSGRAVFAARDIPANTPIFRTDDLAGSVLLREYRREVCGYCFAYEHGRDLRIRDSAVGFSFCSEECRDKWRGSKGDVGVEAWTAVEKLVKGRGKEDCEMMDVGLPRPQEKEITEAWEGVGIQAALIRVARQGERAHDGVSGNRNGISESEGAGLQATKQHRKALQKALMLPISPDIMSFCLSGILWMYTRPTELHKLLSLAPDPTPYHNTADLLAFTRTYLHLLAIAPISLLPFITPSNLALLSSRDSHNSFGIRSLEDDGSEFFGFGCWPDASYFNHSCDPNTEKLRVGRAWEFRAGRDVKTGEELCITYLSGEERLLGKGERMRRLKGNWGFECACVRCGK